MVEVCSQKRFQRNICRCLLCTSWPMRSTKNWKYKNHKEILLKWSCTQLHAYEINGCAWCLAAIELLSWYPLILTLESMQLISKIWAHFLSLARSKLKLCSANHWAGYFSNLSVTWPVIGWAQSEVTPSKRQKMRPSTGQLVPGTRSLNEFLRLDKSPSEESSGTFIVNTPELLISCTMHCELWWCPHLVKQQGERLRRVVTAPCRVQLVPHQLRLNGQWTCLTYLHKGMDRLTHWLNDYSFHFI